MPSSKPTDVVFTLEESEDGSTYVATRTVTARRPSGKVVLDDGSLKDYGEWFEYPEDAVTQQRLRTEDLERRAKQARKDLTAMRATLMGKVVG